MNFPVREDAFWIESNDPLAINKIGESYYQRPSLEPEDAAHVRNVQPGRIAF